MMKMMEFLYENERKYIETFFLDTQTTKQNRIVWMIKSLPEFVRIVETEGEISQVVNLWNSETLSQFASDPVGFVYHANELGFKPIVAITLWASINLSDGHILDQYEIKDLEAYGLDWNTIRHHIDSSDITRKRNRFSLEQDKILKLFKNLQQIPSTNKITGFVEEYSTRKISFNDLSLVSIFNRLRTTDTIPIVTYNNYFKIQNNHIPLLNIVSDENSVMLKMILGTNYINIVIRYFEADVYTIEMATNPSKYNVDTILDEVLDSIGSKREESSKSSIGGYFLYEGIIDMNVFSHLILTSINMDSLICVNDNIKHVGKDGSRNVFFRNPYETEYPSVVNSILSREIAKGGDSIPFKINTQFTRINVVKGVDVLAVNTYRTFFDKLMSVYQLKSEGIAELYDYLGAVETKEKKVVVVEKKIYMKDIDPVVFSGNYARACQPKNRIPTIISYDEIKKAEEEKFQVMEFPKNSDATPDTPVRYYICKDPNYKYPGLVKTNNSLGYAPCCFLEDQQDTGKYRNYYDGAEKEDEKEEKKEQYLKRTDKIVTSGEFGYLPQGEVRNMLPDAFRMGTTRTGDSFLQAIEMALGTSRSNGRSFLLTVPLTTGMQEMYGRSENAIREYIESSEYLDPLKLIRIAEATYKCNILVFDKNNILIPDYIHGYYQLQRNDILPSVYLYRNRGAETDRLRYPHYELLIPDKDIRVWNNEMVNSKCWRIYDKLTQFYVDGLPVPRFQPIPIDNIVGQGIDKSGKTRLLVVDYKGVRINLYTSPLPPLPVSLVDMSTIQQSDRQKSILFLRENGAQSISEIRNLNIQATLNNILVTIYTVTEMNSFQDNFSKNSKIARYVSNWTTYLFSKYVEERKPEVIDKKLISEFVATTFVVVPEFEYSEIGDEFTDNIPAGISRNGKLVCNTDEMLKRLIYQLRLLLERKKSVVLDFYKKKLLENYFVDISDFTKRYDEVVLYHNALESKTKLQDKMKVSEYILRTYPEETLSEPYFIRTNSRVFLTLNKNDLREALGVNVKWNRDGYVDASAPAELVSPFKLYTMGGVYQVEGEGGRESVFGYNQNKFNPLIEYY
jgi:hypothetical protein